MNFCYSLDSIQIMKNFWTLILICFVFGCKENNAKHIQMVDPDPDLEKKLDSIGYPTYYTHPEINDLSALRILLSRSTKVLAYNFNDNNGNPANVECYDLYDSSEICSSATNKRTLNQKQLNELINITTDSMTYTGTWSGLSGVCFIPHLGFGFFKNDLLIAQVNVCFLCNGIRTRPYYKSDGLTKIGFERFSELARQLNLTVVDGSEKKD